MDQDVLLKLLCNNDDKAYRQLYQKYYVALKSFACSYVGNEDVAKDLVQDVFIAMLGCEKKFLNLNEVKLYLYTAVRNRSVSYLRNQKVQNRYIGKILQEDDSSELFWDRVLEEEVYANLMGAIDKLSHQCRTVMLLTLEGQKSTEIAAKMNISVETVKDHKSNGKKKLAILLKDGCFVWLIDFLFI
ncbi:MAG: RNA polymerase sigma-70 factor [Odoribacter sp.]